MSWPDLVAVHNKEFNPREASRNKRTAEEPVEEHLGEFLMIFFGN